MQNGKSLLFLDKFLIFYSFLGDLSIENNPVPSHLSFFFGDNDAHIVIVNQKWENLPGYDVSAPCVSFLESQT